MNRENTGNYGEHFVITRLLSWGYGPIMHVAPEAPYDVIADIYGNLIKIQVKTTDKQAKDGRYRIDCRHTKGRNRGNGSYNIGDYDIMACVFKPYYRMIFLPFGDRQGITRSKEITREEERESWEACLKSLGLEK